MEFIIKTMKMEIMIEGTLIHCSANMAEKGDMIID